MRPSILRLVAPAALAMLFSANSLPALADDAVTDETVQTEGQDSVSDATDASAAKPAKMLHTIPEDSMPIQGAKGPDNKLIRDLIAARPGEEIVICVAGCFSGRDRVVYAQPAEVKPVALMSAMPREPISAVAAPPAKPMKTSQAPVAPSSDPKAPAILNAAGNETPGS